MTTRLAPGKAKVPVKWWTVAERDGYAVPSGRYLVRAEAHIPWRAGDRSQSIDLATPPQDLVMEPA